MLVYYSMSQAISNLVRKFLGLFPPSWPFKAYNILIRIPLLKGFIGMAVKSLVPDHADLPEGTVFFDPQDPVLSGAVSLGQYEPKTTSIFRSLIAEGMAVVDIGANLGYFTLIAAGKVGPSGKVFSYEPDPHNFALLKKNIDANNFRQAMAIPLALSDQAGTRELFFGDNQCTLSFADKRGAGRSETVQTDTLDNSLKAFGSPRIDIIKMDIEGAEPIALEGMKETIARSPKLAMLFEYHPNAIERIGLSPLAFLKRIEELGFALSVIDEDSGTSTSIQDITAFAESLKEKEASRNIVGIKTP